MRRIRTLQCCLLAAAILSAFAAASASAAEYEVKGLPEIGKCTKVAKGAGTYIGASCVTVAAPGKGSYDFTQVAATGPVKFTGAGTEITLATAGHPTIKCVVANLSGEWTGPKTLSAVTIELQACNNPEGKACQTTPTAKSEIKNSVPDEGKLGFIRNEGRFIAVGLDLKPTSPSTTLLSYECEGTSEMVSVGGSVIAKILPLNKMTTVPKLSYLVTKTGNQIPEKFESEVKDTLTSTFTKNVVETTTAPTTLKMKEESGTNAVALEIKAKEN